MVAVDKDTIAALSDSDGIEESQEDNIIEGSGAIDHISAGSGNDLIFAGAGNDVVFGGPGDDRIFGGPGNDDLHGDDGDDELNAGDGADKITGGTGNDEIRGGAGADEAVGDAGNDLFCATIDDGDDYYDGGAGMDTYNLSATSADAVIDLSGCTSASLQTGNDEIIGFENVIGGKGNDVIIADEAPNVLTGGPGQDTFVFRSVASAGMSSGARDKILDFEIGDKIDLSEIDPKFAITFGDALEDLGFCKFVLIQSGEAFTAPAQIRLSYEEFDDKGITVLAGNIDDDSDTEFEIEFFGHKDLKEEDFTSHEPSLAVSYGAYN